MGSTTEYTYLGLDLSTQQVDDNKIHRYIYISIPICRLYRRLFGDTCDIVRAQWLFCRFLRIRSCLTRIHLTECHLLMNHTTRFRISRPKYFLYEQYYSVHSLESGTTSSAPYVRVHITFTFLPIHIKLSIFISINLIPM